MTFSRVAFFALLLCTVIARESAAAESPKKLKVRSVIFEGNQAFSDYRLKKVMLTRRSSFLSRNYYHQNIFEDDLTNLVVFYQNNGYLDAKIEDSRVTADSAAGNVDIFIKISEGELTYVEDVSLFGNVVYGDSLLLRKIKFRAGDPFKRRMISDAALSILTLYADNGYLDAEVHPDVRVNSEQHRALIDFIIDEHDQYRISGIRIVGLEKTKPKVVERELTFHSGDVAQRAQLLESQRRLYLTGLFQSVFIRPGPTSSGDSTDGSLPGYKDILVELKENESIEFNVAVGYGTVEKARARLGIYNNNIAGTARKFGLTPKISFVNRGLEASYTEPWTLGLRWRTDVSVLFDYSEEPGYNLTRKAGRITLGRTFGRHSSIALSFRNEDSRLTNVQVSPVPDELNSFIRSLTLTPIYDTRDNLFNSHDGVYLEWSQELAGSFLGGTDTFLRSILRTKFFHSLRPSTVLATALEIGWMDHLGGVSEIPLNERFYAGGPSSLRGFGYQMVGPLDLNGIPIGGQFKVVCNVLEVRQAVYKIMGIALFGDAGNVWWQVDDFQLKDVRADLGVGLRVNTPIGIVRGDYAVNPWPRSGEADWQLYFNVGQAF